MTMCFYNQVMPQGHTTEFPWFDASRTLAEMVAATAAWPQVIIEPATPQTSQALTASGDAAVELVHHAIELPPTQAIAQLLNCFAHRSDFASVRWVPAAQASEAATALDDAHASLGGLVASSDADLRADERWPELVTAMKILYRVHQWRCQACRDPLTGAYNRGFFDRFLEQAVNLAQQTQAPITLLLLDVDDFKQFNDAYGHATGDQILIALVQLLTSLTRTHDVVARIGGDEFAVIFSETEPPRESASDGIQQLALLVQRFQKAVAAYRYPTLNIPQAQRLRVSTGMANLHHGREDAGQLLHRADQAALKAKQEGQYRLTLGPDQVSH